MALGKVGTVLVGVGALAVLAPAPWRWLAAPSPHYWLTWLTVARDAPTPTFGLGLGAALAAHTAGLSLLARTFRRRVG